MSDSDDPALDPRADAPRDENADYVHPVDAGAGTDELPVEQEDAGSYVSGGDHGLAADRAVDDDEKGDYVTPVDHGGGTRTDDDGDSGEYVDAER